jgi:uncharacterized membrane protein YsdA (DUF1294 family)
MPTTGQHNLKRSAANRGGASTWLLSSLAVTPLLVLPAVALHRRAVDLRWTGLFVLAISIVAYAQNRRDKRLAQTGEWRISEAQLHFWELMGGWPGAWIAQRQLRHKTSKRSYQVVFWIIVLAHQFIAFDSLRNWDCSRAALAWVQASSHNRNR